MYKTASRVKILLKLKKFLEARPGVYTPDKAKKVLQKSIKNIYSEKPDVSPLSKLKEIMPYRKALDSDYFKGQDVMVHTVPNYESIISRYPIIKGRQLAKNIINEVERQYNTKNLLDRFFTYLQRRSYPLDQQLYKHIKNSVQDPNLSYIKIPSNLLHKLLKSRLLSPIQARFKTLLPHVSYKLRLSNTTMPEAITYKDKILRAIIKKSDKPFQMIDDPSKYLYGAKNYDFLKEYNKGDALFFSGYPKVAFNYLTGKSGGIKRPLIVRIPRQVARYKGEPSFGSPHLMETQSAVRLKKLKELNQGLVDKRKHIHNPELSINNRPDYQFVLDNTSGNLDQIATYGMLGKDNKTLYQANWYRTKPYELAQRWGIDLTE